MNKEIINLDKLANLKQYAYDDGMSSDIWGAELADGASDFKSTEVRFRIVSKYPNQQLERILIINNGNPLIPKNVVSPFLSLPVTSNDYEENVIGCRGKGTKLTIFRVGCIEYLYSYDEDGRLYKATFTPCSDENGTNPIDFFDDNFCKEMFKQNCLSIRVDYEFFDNIPTECNLERGGKGLEYSIRWFIDSDVKFNETAIKKWLSIRYGQKNNFKIRFENAITDENQLVPKTHMGILNGSNQPIYHYTDFANKYDKPIIVRGIPYELYWDCRVSKVQDIKKWNKLENATTNEYRISTNRRGVRNEAPLILHMNHNDIITNITHIKESSEAGNTWLIFCLRPLKSINEFFASNKSSGYSDESFGKELHEIVEDIIKEESIRNPYWDKDKKQEDSEVVQFRDYICDTDSMGFLPWLMLDGIDQDVLQKEGDWRLPQSDKQTTGYEIDLKAPEKCKIWYEFQNSDKKSDIEHCNGILARILKFGRENSPFNYFVWVAKKHQHIDTLKEQLKGLKWGDGHVKKILFLTSKEAFSQFNYHKVPTIDINDLK